MAETPPNVESPSTAEQNHLLELLAGTNPLTAEALRKLVVGVESLDVIAKVFLLEGTPFVFKKSPMKYMIFREQVADRFGVGYQDVCIVGSAKLGFSPSPHKFGRPFADQSDVDVVVVSEALFNEGTLKLFEHLNHVGPPLHQFGFSGPSSSPNRKHSPAVKEEEWKDVKEGVRNYVFQNFNPGLLPDNHPMKIDIFQRIRSTAPLFMALEPTVFVSKIRCRIFRNWKAAEDYYANTLRQLRRQFQGEEVEFDPDVEEASVHTPDTAVSVSRGPRGVVATAFDERIAGAVMLSE